MAENMNNIVYPDNLSELKFNHTPTRFFRIWNSSVYSLINIAKLVEIYFRF